MVTVIRRGADRLPIEPTRPHPRAADCKRSRRRADAPLVATKLEVPHTSQRIMFRSRLLDLLECAVDGPLTVLVAPAGAGKTVLMSSWAEAGRAPGPVAWLSVDALDNDATRFWAHVLAALRHSGAVPAGGILCTLTPPLRGSDETFLCLLVGGLAELLGPVVLVLDDLDEVNDPAVLVGLEFMMRHAPAQLRLVVGTRAEPDLSLHRMRVTGDLTELRVLDLAFTQDEARELLTEQGVALTEAALASLWARTEGWPAGLRLASLSLKHHPEPGRFVEEFTGDDRTVADYLLGEVLVRLPAATRDFLLQTCVVDRLSGGLARALTGDEGADLLLVELERANAFLTAEGRSRSWYRYHQLFVDLLRAELQRRHPLQARELHRRAAAWYAANGCELDAIRHAIAAEAWDVAAQLVVDHWFNLFISGDFINGDLGLLGDLLAQLPSELVGADPELAVAYAGTLLGLGDLERADLWLERAEAATAASGEQRRHLALAAAVVRLLRARAREDPDGAVVAAQELLTLAQAQASAPGWDRFGSDADKHALVLANLGVAKLWAGDLDAAASHLEQGLTVATRAERDFLVLDCLSMLALLAGIRGQARRAARTAQAALELAARGGWSRTSHAAWAHLVLAWVHHTRDELPDAHRCIVAASEAARHAPTPTLAAAVTLGRALILTADGNPAAGLGVLRGMQDLWHRQPSPAARRVLCWGEARLLALAGDSISASTLAGTLGLAPSDAPAFAVVQARLRLAGADPDGAVEALAPCLDGTVRLVHLPALIEAWLLDAVARAALGDRYGAACSVERAIELAEPEGHCRVFVEAGAPVHALLSAALERGSPHAAFISELLNAASRSVRDGGGDFAALPEQLTDRERAVLRYLPTVMSTTEIASQLFVSVNTVKTHLQHIYRKLDSAGRRDAVRRARELELL